MTQSLSTEVSCYQFDNSKENDTFSAYKSDLLRLINQRKSLTEIQNNIKSRSVKHSNNTNDNDTITPLLLSGKTKNFVYNLLNEHDAIVKEEPIISCCICYLIAVYTFQPGTLIDDGPFKGVVTYETPQDPPYAKIGFSSTQIETSGLRYCSFIIGVVNKEKYSDKTLLLGFHDGDQDMDIDCCENKNLFAACDAIIVVPGLLGGETTSKVCKIVNDDSKIFLVCAQHPIDKSDMMFFNIDDMNEEYYSRIINNDDQSSLEEREVEASCIFQRLNNAQNGQDRYHLKIQYTVGSLDYNDHQISRVNVYNMANENNAIDYEKELKISGGTKNIPIDVTIEKYPRVS